MEGSCAMPTVNVNICPEISKKNHLFRIIVLFMMLLFAVCAADVFFCGNHDRNELSDQSFMIETMTASGSAAADGDKETITKDICPASVVAVVPDRFRLLLYLVTFLLSFYLTLFILLSDEWTLINQKIRLDI